MSRKIEWQRCFKVPADRLDVFLCKLNMSSGDLSCFEAGYIFQTPAGYDVVVEEFGSRYPFQENEIEDFAREFADDGDQKYLIRESEYDALVAERDRFRNGLELIAEGKIFPGAIAKETLALKETTRGNE